MFIPSRLLLDDTDPALRNKMLSGCGKIFSDSDALADTQ
jgi:hypothetical protein